MRVINRGLRGLQHQHLTGADMLWWWCTKRGSNDPKVEIRVEFSESFSFEGEEEEEGNIF